MKIVRFQHKKKMGWGFLEDSVIRSNGSRIPCSQAKLLSPIAPSKIIMVGLNYRDHAREMGSGPGPNHSTRFVRPGLG